MNQTIYQWVADVDYIHIIVIHPYSSSSNRSLKFRHPSNQSYIHFWYTVPQWPHRRIMAATNCQVSYLADDIFKCIFLNENWGIGIDRNFNENTCKSALFLVMAGCLIDDQPLPGPILTNMSLWHTGLRELNGQTPGACLNIKMSSYQKRDSHYKDMCPSFPITHISCSLHQCVTEYVVVVNPKCVFPLAPVSSVVPCFIVSFGCRYSRDSRICRPWIPIHNSSSSDLVTSHAYRAWASYQIRKIASCACARNAGKVFPTTDLTGNCQLAISACITARASRHVSGSVIHGGGRNGPGIPGACAISLSGKRPIQISPWLYTRMIDTFYKQCTNSPTRASH